MKIRFFEPKKGKNLQKLLDQATKKTSEGHHPESLSSSDSSTIRVLGENLNHSYHETFLFPPYLLVCLLLSSLQAQVPELVKDIRLQTEGSNPADFLEFQGQLYFRAYSQASEGYELWQTDGTTAGTQLFADLWPGPNSSFPHSLTLFQGQLFFSARDSAHGRELWISNGTPSGTQMYLDVIPGPTSTHPEHLFPALDLLFFTSRASSSDQQDSLWRSDGTAAGTFSLLNIHNTASQYGFTRYVVVDSTLYFIAGSNFQELWKTDGSLNGTVLIKDFGLNPYFDFTIDELTAFAGAVFFTMETEMNGREIWRSDGTTNGTQLFLDLQPGLESSRPADLTVWGDTLFFSANGPNNRGIELWKTGPNPSDTALVHDIFTGPTGSVPVGLTLWQDALYFSASSIGMGQELWKTDGTATGTVLVKDIEPNGSSAANQFYGDPSGLYFSARIDSVGRELWRTDGTETGTYLLQDIYIGAFSSFPTQLASYGGKVWFQANGRQEGVELWATDGSSAQTSLIKDLCLETKGSIPDHLLVRQNQLLMVADDGIHGSELWESDGTASGTQLLKDIWPGETGSKYRLLTLADSLVFFVATTPADGKSSGELWKTNGTEAGTQLVKEIVPGTSGPSIQEMVWFQDQLYFIAQDSQYGREIWVSDGTESGTQVFVDVETGEEGSFPNDLTVVGNQLYFTAKGATPLWALYVSDGTASGTQVIKDPVPSSAVIGKSGSYLYFQAATPASIHDTELWRTDGTIAGTELVKDIFPGPTGSTPFQGATLGQKMAFIAQHPDYGRELWITNGTESGTRLLKEFYPGNEAGLPPYPTDFHRLGNRLIFVGVDSTYGHEIWRTNGTTSGTWLIQDIVPGFGSSFPRMLGSWQDRILFSASTPEDGRELWITDGTSQGTYLLWAFQEGVRGTNFESMAVLDNYAYLSLSTPEVGTELWKLPPSILSNETDGPILEMSLQLFPNPTEGQFQVQLKRNTRNVGELSLFSLDGRRIYRKIIRQEDGAEFTQDWDLTTLPGGMYLVQYQEPGRVVSQKVVKK